MFFCHFWVVFWAWNDLNAGSRTFRGVDLGVRSVFWRDLVFFIDLGGFYCIDQVLSGSFSVISWIWVVNWLSRWFLVLRRE